MKLENAVRQNSNASSTDKPIAYAQLLYSVSKMFEKLTTLKFIPSRTSRTAYGHRFSSGDLPAVLRANSSCKEVHGDERARKIKKIISGNILRCNCISDLQHPHRQL